MAEGKKKQWSLKAEFVAVTKFSRSGDTAEEAQKSFEEDIEEYLEDTNFLLVPTGHPAAGLVAAMEGSGVLTIKRVSLSRETVKVLKELPPKDDDDDDDDDKSPRKDRVSMTDKPDCEGCPQKTSCPGIESCENKPQNKTKMN